jgi:hypothetical protein
MSRHEPFDARSRVNPTDESRSFRARTRPVTPPALAAVVVHGPPTVSLATSLWSLGLRPVSGSVGATIWLPKAPGNRDQAS